MSPSRCSVPKSLSWKTWAVSSGSASTSSVTYKRRRVTQETSFEVRVPAALLAYGFDQATIQRQVTEWLVLSLFTKERLSSGKAAQLLGISRVAFLAFLRKRSIAYIDYSAEELADEFEAARSLDTALNTHARPEGSL